MPARTGKFSFPNFLTRYVYFSFLLAGVLVFNSPPLFAQITFQKLYGGVGDNEGTFIHQTSDGGFIMAGKSKGQGFANSDILLIRTNALGDTLWTMAIGDAGYDQISSIRQTSDGGFLMAGVYASNPATADPLLFKLSANGNVVWKKLYGNYLLQRTYCMQATSDGGMILCGELVTGASSNDYLLLKTTSNGSPDWCMTYGGNSSQVANYVEQTTNGNYIITGSNAGSIELLRTDNYGNLLWSKNYGNGFPTCVHPTTDGGFAVLGYGRPSVTSADDILLKRTDGNGNLLWAKRYGGPSFERGYDFALTKDGGFILAGITQDSLNYNLMLIKTDASGTVTWSRKFESSDFHEKVSVKQTADQGYVVLGKFGSGNSYLYVVKTDSSGHSGCNQADVVIPEASDSLYFSDPGTPSAQIFLSERQVTLNSLSNFITQNTLCSAGTLPLPVTDTLPADITILPNPSDGNFEVLFTSEIISGKITVFNTAGQVVYRKTVLESFREKLSLNELVRGMYFLEIYTGDSVYDKKILVIN